MPDLKKISWHFEAGLFCLCKDSKAKIFSMQIITWQSIMESLHFSGIDPCYRQDSG